MNHYLQQLQHRWQTVTTRTPIQQKNFSPYLTWCPGVSNHLLVDTHAHWLPGVDDGAPDPETGLSMVRRLADMGFKKLIATPHIMLGRYNNQPDQLRRVFDTFREAAEAAGISIQLELAAEYMLDDDLHRHLRKGRLLTLSGDFVLVEMSVLYPFPALRDTLFELQLRGYQPVLAHPERYGYYHASPERLLEIKEWGALLQLNMLSLVGFYGRKVAETAQWVLQRQGYHFAGTDAHSVRQVGLLQKVVLSAPFRNYQLL